MQTEFEFAQAQAAKKRRDLGMERSSDRADREREGWTRAAYHTVLSLIRWQRISVPTLGEDIRAMAYGLGLPPPPDERAWGSVFAKLRKGHDLVPAGVGKAKSSNLSYKPLWVRP